MPSRYCAVLKTLLFVCCLCASGHVFAREADLNVRHYAVAADGTWQLTVDRIETVRAGGALSGRRDVILYSATRDELVAIEAYTRKPDGRRVPVAPDAIEDRPEPTALLPDRRRKTALFPAVAAGDQLVLRYILRRRTPLFPGHFDDLWSAPYLVHGRTTLIYDMPPSMPLHADAAGMAPIVLASPPGQRRYAWRDDGRRPGGDHDGGRIEADAVSAVDDGRRLAVSTFADYPALAGAVRGRAAGQAWPTSALAALAHRLGDGLPDAHARVRAVSDWVRANRPDAVGGRDPPHAAPGTPGDMESTALLAALLAALDIASTPALVNGGNTYTVPDAPTLGVFDRMLLYLPALDLFVDPKGAGQLSPALLGKPALLLETGAFAMTPLLQPHRTRAAATVDVGRDGWARVHVERGDESAAAARVSDDLSDDLSDYRIDLARAGALATTASAWSVVGDAVAAMTRERTRRHDFVCPALDAEDATRLRLPQGARVRMLPPALELMSGGLFYRAGYARQGRDVLVTRRLTFRHGRPTCTPADARAMRPALMRIVRDLQRRIAVAGLGRSRSSAAERVGPALRLQTGHRRIRQIEAQVDAVAARAVAGRPARDLDEAAALEKAGRVRVRVHRDVTRPQLAPGHVQQPVTEQRAADAGAVAVGAHQAEHERAEIVEFGQFIPAEADDLGALDDDKQRAVRLIETGAQPGFFGSGKMVRHIRPERGQHALAVGGAITPDT